MLAQLVPGRLQAARAGDDPQQRLAGDAQQAQGAAALAAR
jgi:hypothetical protein